MATNNMILCAAFVSGAARSLKPLSDFNDVPKIATGEIVIGGVIGVILTKCLLNVVNKNDVIKRTFLYCSLSVSTVYFVYDAIINDIDFDIDYDE